MLLTADSINVTVVGTQISLQANSRRRGTDVLFTVQVLFE